MKLVGDSCDIAGCPISRQLEHASIPVKTAANTRQFPCGAPGRHILANRDLYTRGDRIPVGLCTFVQILRPTTCFVQPQKAYGKLEMDSTPASRLLWSKRLCLRRPQRSQKQQSVKTLTAEKRVNLRRQLCRVQKECRTVRPTNYLTCLTILLRCCVPVKGT